MRLKNYLLVLGISAGSAWTAQATTCPNATPITTVPVTNQTIVCGTTNDIAASNVTVSCGDTNFYRGLEALYVWTPTASGQTTISFSGYATGSGIFVFQGCPTSAGAICKGNVTNNDTAKSLTLNVFAGTQYYILFDLSTTPSPCAGTGSRFSITAPVACAGAPTVGMLDAAQDTVCAGNSTQLTLAGQTTTGGVTFQWQRSTTSSTAGFSNIAGATDTSYTTPAIAATNYFRVKAICPFTNDSAFSNVLTVRARSLPVVNLGNDSTVCGNIQTRVLNAGNLGASYTWAGMSVTTQTLNVAPFINAINNGFIVSNPFYQTSVVVTDGFGCVGRDTIRFNINYSPRVADFDISGLDPTLIFTPIGDSATTSYRWIFGDGDTATIRTAMHTYTTSGVYTVRFIAINSCGRDTVTKQVQVTATGIEKAPLSASLTLFPNPATRDAVLEVAGSATLRSVQLLSATGALVMSQPLAGTRAILSTSALVPGIYTLRIQLDKGVVVRKLEVLR